MPDLIARLSGLHAIITNRLALQESLLSLSGRLDMVLSQIEMRSSAAPAVLAPQKGKKAADAQKDVRRYVEGESEEEEQAMDVEVEIESGDGGESAEDIELGGNSDEDEEEDEEEFSEEEEDSSADDDSDYGGPPTNGFIDDEAEESSGEGEESE
jgi:U3 small nucleolar RNA-associated protein 5